MFLAGVPAEQIIAADQRVYDSIATINPVLIHLVPDDPQRHLKWVFQERCLAPDPRPPKMWTDWFVEIFPTTIRAQSVLGHTRLIPAPRNRNGEAPSQRLAKH
jgi:hypothetical protein